MASPAVSARLFIDGGQRVCAVPPSTESIRWRTDVDFLDVFDGDGSGGRVGLLLACR